MVLIGDGMMGQFVISQDSHMSSGSIMSMKRVEANGSSQHNEFQYNDGRDKVARGSE